MSKSLIIDPGHGGSDPGANGFGDLEKDWNLKMSLYQYRRLKELGAKVSITRTNDSTLTQSKRVGMIKSKYDYCLSNHFNSFNGSARGVETIHSIYGGKDEAEKIAKAVTNTSGLPLRRVFKKTYPGNNNLDYYYMHRLTGTTRTIIAEYGFIDNKQDNEYYSDLVKFYEVAEAVVKVWCQILGVKYKNPKTASGEKGTLYKVQVGAFSNKQNAINLVNELESKGYTTYIVGEKD